MLVGTPEIASGTNAKEKSYNRNQIYICIYEVFCDDIIMYM